MADLDKLIGSRISLISQQDIRYDGVLFNINPEESSIVLRDVKCLGTEDRVPADSPAAVPSSASHVLPFVSFPGPEIKDLYLHEQSAASAPAPSAPSASSASLPQPPAKNNENKTAPPKPPQQQNKDPKQNQQQNHHHQQQQQRPKADRGSVGTGEHLKNLKERKAYGNENKGPELSKEEFNMQDALKNFNKEAEKAKLAAAQAATVVYDKDDFFDNMSSDIVDRMQGKSSSLRRDEERALNVDTFGSTGLQNGYRYRGRGRGGYGRGGGGRYNNNQGRGGRGRYNNNQGGRGNNGGRGRATEN